MDKQYLFRNRDSQEVRLAQDLEFIALNSFMKYVRTCPALLMAIGNPKNLQEAVDLMERYEPDMEIAEVEDEKAKTPTTSTNNIRRKSIRCQNCANEGHEAFFCPVNPCIYCKSSMHKSSECKVVQFDVKINIICKECKMPGHTIDPCPQRDDSERCCQYCQAANVHTTYICEVAINLSKLNDVSKSYDGLNLNGGNGMTNARWNSELAIQNNAGPQDKTCWYCGKKGHFSRDYAKTPIIEEIRGKEEIFEVEEELIE